MLRISLPAIVALAALAALALPAAAQERTADAPNAALSLHDGPLDMVAYYTAPEAGVMEVTATFATRTVHAAPMRVVMALGDGERTSFAMPGFRGSNYTFERQADALTVSVTPLTRTALND